ncbi:YhgE/Pip domain-containing protein [Paeniglutamicibacter antarcticus]|uniref:YhgE/Pip domain-containing protein n=1 Tax=Arthrobacter terrae TaxID=2935737 RepID=A0A931CK66_9MICC|nr:YhgE/Pip domain-containing protein [Arthrobacter terrae]MBG0740092.1 YhgE/Pip domain-containing protein [Arthrobacter terrae]
MTVLRLALSELKRMTGGLLPKLTILALIMVPLLYGALYLYANWDPYGNLDQLKAAVVVQDQGATTKDGKQLQVGNQVAQTLIDGKKFDWVKVDSVQQADSGVESGEYAFALKIPRDFSENLASPEHFDSAKQAILGVTTNDANNYLLTSIVDKVTTQVHESVAKEVGQATADTLLTGYGTIHAQIVKAADGASQLASGAAGLRDGAAQLHAGTSTLTGGANQLVDGQSQLVAGADRLNTGAAQLSTGLGQLQSQTTSLPTDSQALSTGAAQVAAGNATLNTKVQDAVGGLDQLDAAAKTGFSQRLDALVAAGTIPKEDADKIKADVQSAPVSQAVQDAKAKLNIDAADVQQLAAGSQAVAGGAAKLAAAAPTLTGAITQANDGAAQLSAGAATLASGQQTALDGSRRLASGATTLEGGATKLDDGVQTLSSGAATLADELAKGAGQVPHPDDAQKANAAKVISDPIAVNSLSQAQAANYGSGLAPFFLVLALWIGAFMLVQAMRPVTQRALASNAPSWKIAVGGWLPFFLVSTLQAVVMYLVVYFGLGLNPSHPVLTLGLLLLASMAFTAIIQGVVALLGTVGKFVVLILLVLQLVSSGGTFPWQTTPGPLHAIHTVMPMGHVVEGMRHLIYGAGLAPVGPIVLGLIGYTLFGLLLSFLAVRKHKFWTLKTLQPEIAV